MKYNVNCQVNNEIVVDNRTIYDADEIANNFNGYYIDIGHRLSTQITSVCPYTDYLGEQVNTRFNLKNVDENIIIKIITNLKNKSSYGHDNISNTLIKCSKDVLVRPLTMLINQTLGTGSFPIELKIIQTKAPI